MLSWLVEAVYGVDNRTVRTGTRDAIVREYASGGILWRPIPGECMEQDAFKVFVNEIMPLPAWNGKGGSLNEQALRNKSCKNRPDEEIKPEA